VWRVIRTLDEMHLACVLVARSSEPGVELLCLDERIRRSGAGPGFASCPHQPGCPSLALTLLQTQ
jgi:hypothetical protein